MESNLFRAIAGGAALVSFGLASAGDAQEQAGPATAIPAQAAAPAPVAAPAAVDPTMCELHVWPAERFMAQTSGWLSGFGIVGALADSSAHANKDKSNRTQLAGALDSAGQVDALAAFDLPAMLHLPPSRIVRHDEPLERHTMNSIKTRRAESTAPCYAELIVGDILYQKAPLHGRSLRALFMMRDFASGTTIRREAKGWGGNGLKLFPPKPGEDVQAANDELVQKFKDDFTEYAHNAALTPTPTRS